MNSESGMAMKKIVLLGGGVAGFVFVIVFILIYLKKQTGKESSKTTSKEPPSLVMAQAMASVLRGQESYEKLGKLVFDAVRFGNFSTYKGGFVSIKEVETFFPEPQATTIKNILRDEPSLRRSFEQMRERMMELGSVFVKVGFTRKEERKSLDQRIDATVLYDFSIKLDENEPDTNLSIGCVIKGPFGWKLLLPLEQQAKLRAN
jgi:hypothetical protein